MKKAFVVVVCLVVVIMVVVYARSSKAPAEGVTPDTSSPQTQAQTPATTDQSQAVNTNKDNSQKTSMDSKTTKLPDGLEITVTQEGTGDVVSKAKDNVTVNYTGSLTDGTVFDSSVDPKFGHVSPFKFTLGIGQVIKGWDEGVAGMKIGEKRHLVIPSEIAYGSRGAGALIPPNSTLVFDVEMIAINK